MQPTRASVLAIGLLVGALPAAAQGLDCTKARTPVEQAICATPGLIEQDRALAIAYSARLGREPAQAGALRGEQRSWLANRDRLCASKNEPLQRVAACLQGLYRTRLTAMNAAAAATPAAAMPLPPANPGAAVRPGPAAAPTDAQVLPSPPLPPVAALPVSAAPAEASLSRSTVPAAGRTDVMLAVQSPGRFAIRAESRTGMALQLVSQMSGPGEHQGEPGVKDGRIDELLDAGTYKLRVLGAPNAPGEAKLVIEPVRERGEISAALAHGGAASTDLSDLTQRSWWFQVEKPGRVSVEAAGRSLADLRLWQNGRDLAPVEPRISRVTPKSGHPLTRARIDGEVEPGLYLITAYGGPKLAWTDGDPAEPLHVRLGLPEPMGGWVEGTIGPTGAARFEAPGAATQFLLELPEPTAATLSVRRETGSAVTAAISKATREPFVTLSSSGDPSKPAVVEVSGQEGQPFRLRALDPSASRRISGGGPHWIAVDVAGEGGDEVPATVLLARFEQGRGGRVLASNAPQVGPGMAWRQKLNLRGTASLIFEITGATPIAVATTGPKTNATITPLLGGRPPRTDGRTPRWDLEPGWYKLTLAPVAGAFGALDVTLGPPGVSAEPLRAQAARPSIPLGIQNLDQNGNYQILANEAPGLVLAPVARLLPADLEAAPLPLYQAAGQPLDVPVRMPKAGSLAAVAVNGVPVALALADERQLANGRSATVRLPAPAQARGTVLSWLDPTKHTPVAPPPAAEQLEAVTAGTPRFFDLARDAQRSFAVDVKEGGLYRIETLGRLRTSLMLATSFLPRIDKAEANGAGQNALSLTYLKVGRYRVAVKAQDSAGRLGLTAVPASLPERGVLAPETSVRATLADGVGAVFPIEIAEAGRYRLELFALGEPFRARLEDAEGWPLAAPGPLTTLERVFEPGSYRLVLLPPSVEARAVVRLTRIVPERELSGRGPHPLPFDAEAPFQWREPAALGQERVPDRWAFALAGPAEVTLSLSDGMAGELFKDGETQPVARVVGKQGFSGRLQPGRYTLEARAQGRNDRLDYRVSLSAKELQPGVVRKVELPVTVPFAIAEDRVVSLTTFGRTDLRGILKDSEGRVIERLDDRADDWNIGLSRRLPAGAYTLELSPVEGAPVRQDESPPGAESVDAAAENEAEPAPTDETAEAESGEQPASEQAVADAETRDETPPADHRIEIRLALPESVEQPALDGEGERVVEAAGVRVFGLPAVEAGHLLVVAAKAGTESVLSLERHEAGGRWTVIGTDRGLSPLVAAPGDGDASRPWRVAAWTVDGGLARIEIAARAIHREPGGTGLLSFDPVPLGRVSGDVRIDLTAAPGSGVLTFRQAPRNLLQGSVSGQALRPADGNIVPQGDTVWLVSRGDPGKVELEPAALPLDEMPLTVPAEGKANWPKVAPGAGEVRVWRATSTFGQPGLSGGRGMGVASGSAVALGGYEALRAWNAGGSDALPVRIGARDLKLVEEVRKATEFSGLVQAGTAQPVRLPAGLKRLTFDLPAGTAAIADWAHPHAMTVWAGNETLTRTATGEWTNVLLVNLTPEARPVRLAVAPAGEGLAELKADAALKRFFGAAGSLALRVVAEPGDRLMTAGADATFTGKNGRVLRGGSIPLSGPGELILSHKGGLVAAWLERGGRSPWPEPVTQPVELPSVVKLDGPAMSLALKADGPKLLHVRTSAPVILALAQQGGSAPQLAFPSGAEFHALLTPGDAALRLYSPHDGALAGSVELTASAVIPAGEGIGEPVTVAAGGAVLFGFEAKRSAEIGIGVRAEPDIASVRLLDASGRPLGRGVAQLQKLEPGRYVLEASIPADGRTAIVRPAIVGLEPPPAGPPPDVVRTYLQMVGLAPTAPTR
ncbi:lysozyme inhibitor LprI family protein [Enterovirga sp. CN4-39]|uniref:lysozyme inhibitor LprI family protein n=1 Tax=Enterovirga sp. CN4-39 TaxID=3400910 RepID=UPI003BFBB141